MKTILSVGVIILAVIAYFVWFYNAPPTESVPEVVSEEALTCSDGTVLETQLLDNEHIIVSLNGVPYELSPVVSASGARYANADESFVFWNKGNVSMILVDGEVVFENCRTDANQVDDEDMADVSDMIHLDSPVADSVIESPLTLRGEARGPWFFEASFPIQLTNWDGLIIAEGYATADGDWMTESFVPFNAELVFESPYTEGDPDFMKRGTLILQRDNPSGLPEHDASLELTVWFSE